MGVAPLCQEAHRGKGVCCCSCLLHSNADGVLNRLHGRRVGRPARACCNCWLATNTSRTGVHKRRTHVSCMQIPFKLHVVVGPTDSGGSASWYGGQQAQPGFGQRRWAAQHGCALQCGHCLVPEASNAQVACPAALHVTPRMHSTTGTLKLSCLQRAYAA